MRFMLLIIPKGYSSAKPGTTPDAQAVEKMMAFNTALQEAGVLLSLDGLHPVSMGGRVVFEGGRKRFVEGAEVTGEVLGGYWMIRVGSRQEAIDWAMRVPDTGEDGVVEIRQVQEMEDFPADVQQAAAGFDARWNKG
jgi:hypothetical protein